MMQDVWPSNVTHTYELGSQRGPAYDDKYASFSDVIKGPSPLTMSVFASWDGLGTANHDFQRATGVNNPWRLETPLVRQTQSGSTFILRC